MIELTPSPTASAVIERTGRIFTSHRYTITLEVDGVLFPELHTHSWTLPGARSRGRMLAANAAAILAANGMMGTAYQRIIAARTGRPVLPAAADIVYLARDLGGYKAGTPAIVAWSEWDEDVSDANQYPVAVLFGDSEDPVPLALDDFVVKQVSA